MPLGILALMAEQQLVRCRRCWYMVDPTAGDGRSCPICGATEDDFLPPERRHKLFARLSSYSHIVARLQWDPTAIDLAPDARAWPGLPAERRRRLTTLLAGFCVAEEAVSEHLTPFTSATDDTLVAWVFFLQRRDEERHALLFDRIAGEVLGLPGATPAERRAAARTHVPPEVLELFEVRLPTVAAELAAGRTGLDGGVSLYHMVLEGIVFSAGQRALLEDLEDGALPGVHEGVRRVDLDERWHIGFGLRCLIEARPSQDLMQELLASAEDAATAWGDAVSPATREYVARMCARRLSIAGLIRARAAA
jgi:ribonucleoside-diphosphate reductase beta chain